MPYSRLDQILRRGTKMSKEELNKPEIPPKKEETEEDDLADIEARQDKLAQKAKEEKERDIRREQFQKRCQKLSHPSRRFNESLRQMFRLLKDPEYFDPAVDKDIAMVDVHPDTIARALQKMTEAYDHLRMLREEAEQCLEPNELSQKDKDYLELRQEKITVAYCKFDIYKNQYEQDSKKDWADKAEEDQFKKEKEAFERQRKHAAEFLEKLKEQNAKESEILNEKEKRINEQMEWIKANLERVQKKDSERNEKLPMAQCNLCDELYPLVDIKEHLMLEHPAAQDNEYTTVNDGEKDDEISMAESSASALQMNQMATVFTRMASYQYNIKDHVEVFDSTVETYSSWRSAFDAAAETMTQMGKSKIEQYRALKMVLKGDALTIAEGEIYPNEDSLGIILDIFESQFGQAEMVVEDIIERIMKVDKMDNSVLSLQKGWADLRKFNMMLQMKKLDEKQLHMVYFIGLTKPKISNKCLNKYLEVKKGKINEESPVGTNCTVEDYIGAIESTLKNARAFEKQKKSNQDFQNSQGNQGNQGNKSQSGYRYRRSGQGNTTTMSSFRTGAGRQEGGNGNSQSDRKCSICKRKYQEIQHTKPLHCPELKKKSKGQIMSLINSENLCANCFVPNHFSKNCRSRENCGVNGCRRRHYYLLHDPKLHPTESTQTHGTYRTGNGNNSNRYKSNSETGDNKQSQGDNRNGNSGNNSQNRNK